MIITLIFIVMLVAGIIIVFLTYNNWEYEVLFGCGIVAAVFGGIGMIVCGSVAIAQNNSLKCNTIYISYKEKATQFNNTYDYIMSYTNPDADRYTAIQQYNSEVATFKSDILERQKCLKNYWVNWFVCRQYASFDANAVKYIEVK